MQWELTLTGSDVSTINFTVQLPHILLLCRNVNWLNIKGEVKEIKLKRLGCDE